jgi:hypothetical protein
MDDFIFSFEKNLKRDIYAFGFRTIFLAEEKITSTGQYISDFNGFVEEAFFNATVDGQGSDILIGVNYNDLLDTINEKAGKMNIMVSFSNPQISVSQTDAWNVLFVLSFDLNLSDKANLSSWNKRENIMAFVEIEGFEDPLYLLNTNGKVINKINKTVYQPFEGDVDELLLHTKKGFYIASDSAPSFLDRLQGETEPDLQGIESLVYLPKLSSEGISTKTKSVVDYIYFSSDNPGSQQITGMPSWFRLDDAHRDDYGV